MNKECYVLTIKAEDKPGLLHHITGMINRKRIDIESLSAAKTDIQLIVLITIELKVSEIALAQLALKLENIVEVFGVEATKASKAVCLRAAYFKMAKSFLESPQQAVLQKYGAVIVNIYPESILVAKYGSDLVIRELYNQLDGPHLMGFIQAGLISDTKLIDNDDVRVNLNDESNGINSTIDKIRISRLAA
jgi:acetolactate synthase small subunit